MTIFFFSHAHEQIERENKNKARKKDSFPHFRARASVKVSTPRKTNFSFTFQKTKSHVKLPFSKQLEVFSEGEFGWATNVCICNLATQHLGKIL